MRACVRACWGLEGAEGTRVEEGKMGAAEAARPEGWNEGIIKEEMGWGPGAEDLQVRGCVTATQVPPFARGLTEAPKKSVQPSSGTEVQADGAEGFPS